MRVRIGLAVVAAGTMLAAGCSNDTAGTPVGVATTAPSTSMAPFDGQTLALGEVVQVDGIDGARMQPVADGVVRSYATTVKVTEVGSADQVGDATRGEAYRAVAGGTLLAFTVSVAQDAGADGVSEKVVADVDVDGTQRVLPDFFDGGSGSSTSGGAQVHYVVATPQHRRAVDLELKAAGLVQSFDLLQGRPKGDRPAALYRAAGGTTVRQEALTPAKYKVTLHGDDQVNQITVQTAELGYFGGKEDAVPSNPANGWLSLAVNEDGADGSYAICVTPLTAYTLTDDSGHKYPASATASTVPAKPELIGDTSYVVAFEVPADLAKATLTITPKNVVCEVSTSTYEPVPAHGAPTVEVTLPAT